MVNIQRTTDRTRTTENHPLHQAQPNPTLERTVMAVDINEWFGNRQGAREGIDGWADDEPLPPANEDWLERGALRRAAHALTSGHRSSGRTAQPPGGGRSKRKTLNRPHPDGRRILVDAVRREAERCPQWNAGSIAKKLTRRGFDLDVADDAQITGRALPAVPSGRPVPAGRRIARSAKSRAVSIRQPAEVRSGGGKAPSSNRRPSAGSGSIIKNEKWVSLAVRLKVNGGNTISAKSIRTLLILAGFPTVTTGAVKRALTQSGLFPAPAQQPSPRRRRAGGNGQTPRPQVSVPAVAKCSSCSGSIDVLGHCRCS